MPPSQANHRMQVSETSSIYPGRARRTGCEQAQDHGFKNVQQEDEARNRLGTGLP